MVFDVLEDRRMLSTVSPWQNPLQPADVDANGYLSSADALAVLHHLRLHGAHALDGEFQGLYLDPTGDGSVAGDDADLVVDKLLTAIGYGQGAAGAGGEALLNEVLEPLGAGAASADDCATWADPTDDPDWSTPAGYNVSRGGTLVRDVTDNDWLLIDYSTNELCWYQVVIATAPPAEAVNGGSLTLSATGELTYQAPDAYAGQFSFQYRILNDRGGYYEDATVTITVTNHAPLAVNDAAYAGPGEAITIDVLHNDTDADDPASALNIASVTQPSQGTAQIAGRQITYTASPTASGNDSFTYTISDPGWNTSTATVNVVLVNVSNWTLERQTLNGNWVAVPSGELSWSHDTLRWTPVYAPTSPVVQQSIEWRKDDRTVAGRTWQTFASATGTAKAVGNPGVGQWDITPRIEFSAPHQTNFFVQMQAPNPHDVAEIASIEWTTHQQDSAEAGTLEGFRFYPDATAPGGAARKKVDILISLNLQRANVPIYLQWYDVDDPTDSDGPIDDDRDDPGDVNDPDNFHTGTEASVVLATSVTTGPTGQSRATLQINWIQPGNNFRIAAAPRQAELSPTKPLSLDSSSRLFYDTNNDSTFSGAAEFALDESVDAHSAHGIRVTPVLTIWRKLHVEVDSMGAVAGNTVHVNIALPPVNNQNGTSTIALQNVLPLDDNNRFEGGTLTDSRGFEFTVINNTVGTVLVNNLGGIVPAQGEAQLRDDDRPFDTFDVPMPDYSELDEALEEAFITVEVTEDNTNVPFVLNVAAADAGAARDWDTVNDNSVAYWVTYVLGAFQYEPSRDNDPVTEAWVLGTNATSGPNNGGSLIYLETIRDVSAENNWDAVRKQQDTVVHEVGHGVANYGAEPVTRFYSEGVYSRYTEEYLWSIRYSQKPRNPNP
jgi:hypothetical protein